MAKNTTKQGVLATEGSEAAPQLSLFEGPEDVAAAFLDRWTDDQEDKKKPASDQTEVDTQEEPVLTEESEEQDEPAEETEESEDPEETEEDEETEDDEEESEEEEDGEDDESEPEKVLEDEAVVEVKVDDQTLKVSVKDLKRLYGQEAALTKKSQQVAQKRKEIEAQSTKLNATLERMYKKAQEKWEPYSKVDMLIAAKTLDAEEFTALRNAANAAYEEFQFVTQEVDGYIKEAQQEQQSKLQEAAKEAVKVLKEQIPGWNQEVYGKILSYGMSQGLDQEMVNNLVDPVALMLIHKARLYDEGLKVVTKKKVKTAKKIMKPAANPSEKFDSEKKTRAEQRFKHSGQVDDAAELFLSRWTD
jgi:hypothetical protein